MIPLKIFIDSDAFVAFIKRNDSLHAKAKSVFEKLEKREVIFFSSNYVFSETITVLSQRVSHEIALEFITLIKNPENGFLLERIDEALEEEAIEIFKKQKSKNTSFIDCTNIALVKRLAIDAIFSFDNVYRQNNLPMIENLLIK